MKSGVTQECTDTHSGYNLEKERLTATSAQKVRHQPFLFIVTDGSQNLRQFIIGEGFESCVNIFRIASKN